MFELVFAIYREFDKKATTATNDIQNIQAEMKKLKQENEHLKQQLNDKGKECERLKQQVDNFL